MSYVYFHVIAFLLKVIFIFKKYLFDYHYIIYKIIIPLQGLLLCCCNKRTETAYFLRLVQSPCFFSLFVSVLLFSSSSFSIILLRLFYEVVTDFIY